MQSIISQLDRVFREAIRKAFGFDADPLIGLSQNDKFGDYQSNAAMGLAKVVAEKTGQKTNPRAIAEQVKAALDLGEIATEISIAGPGFINVRISPNWLAGQLQELARDERLGISAVSAPQTVVVDYSGPNIAKQMHVGHLRSTIIGDAISRVIEFQGHRVIRQNHVGDWGTQFGRVVLAIWYRAMASKTLLENMISTISQASRNNDDATIEKVVREVGQLHQQWLDLDENGTKVFLPFLRSVTLNLEEIEALYQFVNKVTEHPAAKEIPIRHDKHGVVMLANVPRLITTFIQRSKNDQHNENYQEYLAWDYARTITLETCQKIYDRLGVLLRKDHARGESFYDSKDAKVPLSDIVRELLKKGIAETSEGAVGVFIDGHDKSPLIVQKKPEPQQQEGAYLYGTTDLAAIRFRINELRANRIIYTHDSRQAQHFRQVFDTARKASWTRGDEVKLDYAPFGTMLGEDGKPFKTRSGDTVKLVDLLDEAEERALKVVTEKSPELPEEHRRAIARSVGIGGIKYSDLSKDRISDYVFSWDKMLALDGNTAPYLQYAYARIRSIFRKSGNMVAQATMPLLESPFELALAKHVVRLGELIDLVGRELKPHHLCTYLYELASKFSGFYENCPVLQSDEPTRSSRLLLCDLTARTMALGLDLLGIEHPEQM